MKRVIATSAALAAFAMISAPAAADDHTTSKGWKVVESSNGKATKVSKDGFTYDVCMSDAQDSCINPREAGLNFGNWPLNYWPGKPASEFDGPLPPKPPR